MAAPEGLVSRIKESMRIRHDRLDGDIRGNIEAAMADMGMRGVAAPEGDALAGKACELYCKWQCDYLGRGEAFRQHYEGLRDSMSLSAGYRTDGKK